MFKIREFKIGGDSPCFIIAEIGQNHQGDVEIAKKMIVEAKECGVNCVKFQKSSLPGRFTKRSLEAPYSGNNSFGRTYGEHRSHLEFSNDQFKELQRFAEKEVGIMFSSSCMDNTSATFLESIGIPFMKIGSGDTNNPILIEHVAKMNIPVIFSTGMCDLETVKDGYKILKEHHLNFALLHCVSAYPTPPEDANLRILSLYKTLFPDVPIGYSGHEKGINISIAAVALGAKVIERHFTLDKEMKGTDHACSLNPSELKQLVSGIREVELAMGSASKSLLKSELPCKLKLGKTIVAAKLIDAGEIIQLSSIAIKVSIPHGMQPKFLRQIIGKKATRLILEDAPILFEDVELS